MTINKGYLTADKTAKGDELYTPAYAVKPLIPYLDKLGVYLTVWCPFDDETSEYVKVLSECDFIKVIYSNLNDGQDFFTYEPDEYDIINSNPPFSKKDEVLKRLQILGKPFMILMPLPALQGQKRFKYLQGCQALIFDKRINFYTDKEHTQMQKGCAFASFYLCSRDLLPKDLIFSELIIE